MRCNECRKLGLLAMACRSKANSNDRNKTNHIDETEDHRPSEEYSLQVLITVKQVWHPVVALVETTVPTKNRYCGLQEEEHSWPCVADQVHYRYRKSDRTHRRKDQGPSGNGIGAGADGWVSSGTAATGFSMDLRARSNGKIFF